MTTPWTSGYYLYKSKLITEALQNENLLAGFRHNDPLPSGYGYGVDERCIEYPWLIANLSCGPGLLLDAGSTLNHDFILDHPALQGKGIHILTLAPEANCFWQQGISYLFHDLRDIPIRDNYYDTIVCISTLEHIGCDNTFYTGTDSHRENKPEDFIRAMQELRRVLRPGGTLFLTVPFGVHRHFGTFQQFDRELLKRAANVFSTPTDKAIQTFYRYTPGGWNIASADDCADCEYVGWITQPRNQWPDPIPVERDLAAAARAVACVQMVKGQEGLISVSSLGLDQYLSTAARRLDPLQHQLLAVQQQCVAFAQENSRLSAKLAGSEQRRPINDGLVMNDRPPIRRAARPSTLSLCIVTKDSAGYIEKLLRAGRELADEIVIAVDSSSTDSTEEICRTYADKLFRVEPLGSGERAQAWLNEQCTGDWILRLDDDELPSAGLISAIPRLINDREMTHYWLPRRWVIGDDRARWIAQQPWWPDCQLRLFRNLPSIIRTPSRLHTSYIIQGGARFLTEGSIYHFDLVYHNELERRQKVERYERISPGNSLGHYYLPPDEAALTTLPIPADDAPWDAYSRVTARNVSLAELRQSSLQGYECSPELFKAKLECVDCPRVMRAGQPCMVSLDVRNEGAVAWSLPGLGAPEVRISYHWLRATGEMYDYEGNRTGLPHTLRPGGTTRLIAQVLPPGEPGCFILQWDMVIEDVSWFSTQGWQGPSLEVRVIDDGQADAESPSSANRSKV